MPLLGTWVRFVPMSLRNRFDGRPNLLRIVTNVGWLFGDRILRLGVGLLIGVWIARYLGPEKFGLLNYALAYVGLFLPLAMLGLDHIAVRDLVADPEHKQETLGTAFSLKLIGGIFAYGFALLGIIALKPDVSLLHTLVALVGVVLISQSFEAIDFWFLSQVRAKHSVIARNASFLAATVLRLCLIVAAAPLVAFAVAAALEATLTAIGLVVAYHWNGERVRRWRLGRARAWELLHASWPLIFSHLAIAVYMKIDQVMLGEMRGDGEVGIYSAAVRISEVWYFIPTAIVSSVVPTLINAKRNDAVLYAQRTQQLLNHLALLGYGAAIVVSLLAGPLIWLLYGSEYEAAALPLAVHVWAGLFVCLGLAQSAWLINEGYTRFSLVSTLIGAVINVALNFVLIPHYGSQGAAAATLVAYGITVGAICFLYRPARPLARMTLKALLIRR